MFYVDCIQGASLDPPGDVDGGALCIVIDSFMWLFTEAALKKKQIL